MHEHLFMGNATCIPSKEQGACASRPGKLVIMKKLTIVLEELRDSETGGIRTSLVFDETASDRETDDREAVLTCLAKVLSKFAVDEEMCPNASYTDRRTWDFYIPGNRVDQLHRTVLGNRASVPFKYVPAAS